ncbi:hypothetical protein A2U01_0014343 [Trifolium medium]|uniref:Uncharacterized protein n=1 Tax=Trifolium medium TaxID=97028 RepID=A0A392N4H8_9FABA|nr:hypothetical protein [Trifolium medium]
MIAQIQRLEDKVQIPILAATTSGDEIPLHRAAKPMLVIL